MSASPKRPADRPRPTPTSTVQPPSFEELFCIALALLDVVMLLFDNGYDKLGHEYFKEFWSMDGVIDETQQAVFKACNSIQKTGGSR